MGHVVAFGIVVFIILFLLYFFIKNLKRMHEFRDIFLHGNSWQVTKDSDTDFVCEICYGTTYKGGFDKIPSRVKLRNGPVKVTEFSFGHKVDATKEAWTITYPVMNSGDFFRTKKGEIYEVDGIKRKEEGGILLQQLMSLKLIQTTDPYYQIFK